MKRMKFHFLHARKNAFGLDNTVFIRSLLAKSISDSICESICICTGVSTSWMISKSATGKTVYVNNQ